MMSQSSFHPFQISQTQDGGLQIIEHGERKYAPRISAQEWERIKPVLTALNSSGTTRAEMRRIIIDQYNLSPSINQLNAKLAQWDIKPKQHWRPSTRALLVVTKHALDSNPGEALPENFLGTVISDTYDESEREPKTLSEKCVKYTNGSSSEKCPNEHKSDDQSEYLTALLKHEKEVGTSQNPSTRTEGICEPTLLLNTNSMSKSTEEVLMNQKNDNKEHFNSNEMRIPDGSVEQDPVVQMSIISGYGEELQPIINSDLLDKLFKSLVEDAALDHREACEVMQDIALFLSLLRCSSAAFSIYSDCTYSMISHQAISKMRLRAVIDCSRTATSLNELIAARDMFEALAKQLVKTDLCRCVSRDLIAVLDANDWHCHFPELKTQCMNANAYFGEESHRCNPDIYVGQISEDTSPFNFWYAPDNNLPQLARWASHQIEDIAVLEAWRLFDEPFLGTCHEILLTCFLTRKWTLKWMKPQEIKFHGVEIAVAVQTFAVVARCAIKTINEQHRPVSAEDVTLEMLAEGSGAVLGCARRRWILIHRDILFPDLLSRYCKLGYGSPRQVSNIRTYIYDTISLMTNFAVTQRVKIAVNQSVRTLQEISNALNTKAESIAGFSGSSISSVSIRSGESDSMRSFRNTSKRAQRLLSRPMANEYHNLPPPSRMSSHMSWEHEELTKFLISSNEELGQETAMTID